MKLFKNICLIIFAIITILFTVGYASQPIASIYSTDSMQFNKTFYISNNTELIKLFYLCIAITILLTVGIIIALLGFKFISKLLFFVILIMMIVVYIIIKVYVFADELAVMVDTETLKFPTISNGSGYYLILTSTIAMFVNYILYVFLG